MKRLYSLLIACCLLFSARSLPASAPPTYWDVIVYGGNAAGVMAAIAARKAGASVLLLSPEKHLGGVTTSGLGWTDIGDHRVIGGLTRDFFRRIYQYYQQPAAWPFQAGERYDSMVSGIHRPADGLMWTFEPHVAEKVLEDMLREQAVTVRRGQLLDRKKGVTLDSQRIVSLKILHGKRYTARVFIDATYEGDLMADAGVSFAEGREANSTYDETINGVEVRLATKNNLPRGIDPYRKPGDPASGLLRGIDAQPPGPDGSADSLMQAYCYRVCLTNVPADRVRIRKPAHYRAEDFELVVRAARLGETRFWKTDPMPNGKTDSNNACGISTDLIGGSNGYAEAGYQRRRQIDRRHRYWTLGLIWTVQHDPRIPESVRRQFAAWGLPRDEFKGNGHFPYELYVREARRMTGDFVMTQQEIEGKKPVADPIAMGYYTMDSHNVRRYVTGRGDVLNEGDVEVPVRRPYPIPYGVIVPRRAECVNLLVPVCLSATHMAYGSIRMEPDFMMIGEAAGAAAALAARNGEAVQQVSYAALKKILLADGQVLSLTRR